jgi:hypothetical protein
MYIPCDGMLTLSPVCLGKVKSEARADQLIAFARCLREALPIKYRDLPSGAFNQTSTFKLPGTIRDGWPLDTQHFGEQALSDRTSDYHLGPGVMSDLSPQRASKRTLVGGWPILPKPRSHSAAIILRAP